VGKTSEQSPKGKTEAPASGLRPVYVVCGPDDGLRSRALQKLLERIGNDGSVTEYSGGSVDLADVLDEVRTVPLLSDRRIVVVRDADPFITAWREKLEDYLASPCPTGTLVLEPKRWPSNTRLARLVENVGESIRCDVPSGRQFDGWLAQFAASLGKQIVPAAVQLLRDLLGKDEPAIYLSEIEKLATFVGERQVIQIEDVEALVTPMRAELVFAVTDAIAERNVGAALGLWEQVLAGDREAQFKAVGGLAWGLRRLIKARRLLDRGVSMGQALKEAQLWGDNAAKRAQAFSTPQLEAQLIRLAQIDLATKTGGDIRTEVQNFIVAACAK
jgi:DNA polymerase-3 subunit delta